MPKPRTPLAVARANGAMKKNPQRYRNRHEPVDDRPLGDPPDWLKPDAREAWLEMVPHLPWLRYCHRSIVALTAYLAGKLRTGALGVSGMVLLTQCLGSLGATPASFQKIRWSGPVEQDDEGAEFLR